MVASSFPSPSIKEIFRDSMFPCCIVSLFHIKEDGHCVLFLNKCFTYESDAVSPYFSFRWDDLVNDIATNPPFYGEPNGVTARDIFGHRKSDAISKQTDKTTGRLPAICAVASALVYHTTVNLEKIMNSRVAVVVAV